MKIEQLKSNFSEKYSNAIISQQQSKSVKGGRGISISLSSKTTAKPRPLMTTSGLFR